MKIYSTNSFSWNNEFVIFSNIMFNTMISLKHWFICITFVYPKICCKDFIQTYMNFCNLMLHLTSRNRNYFPSSEQSATKFWDVYKICNFRLWRLRCTNIIMVLWFSFVTFLFRKCTYISNATNEICNGNEVSLNQSCIKKFIQMIYEIIAFK